MAGYDLTLLEWVGVAVFALTGALVAARKQMDPFGFALLATATGIGGGTLRDLLLGVRPVGWVTDPIPAVIAIAVGVAAYLAGAHLLKADSDGHRAGPLVWADAVGLCLFSVTGTFRAIEAGAGPIAAVVLGTITATFGGIIRDMFAGEVPLVLRREIYVTAAALAALALVLLLRLGISPPLAALAAGGLGFVLRAVAVTRHWSLPTFPPR